MLDGFVTDVFTRFHSSRLEHMANAPARHPLAAAVAADQATVAEPAPPQADEAAAPANGRPSKRPRRRRS